MERPLEALRRHPHHLGMAGVAFGLAAASPGLDVALAIGAIGGGVLAIAGAGRSGVAFALLVGAGAWVGLVRLDALEPSAAGPHSGARVAGRAFLLEPPRPGRFDSQAAIRMVSGAHAGQRLLARTGPGADWPQRTDAGSELRLSGTVGATASAEAPPTGDGFSPVEYLARRNLAAELLLTGVTDTGRHRGGIAGALDALRRQAGHGVSAGLEGESRALLAGMVLGRDERIPVATRDDWRAAGLAHLLAVSGQNVMLLAALALPVLAAAGLGPRARLGALLGLIAFYVPLAGAGPSLQRAGVMGAAGIVAMALARPASGVYAITLAAAVTLVVNPRATEDPGWQLSFAAVAGILALGPWIRTVLLSVAVALRPVRARRRTKAGEALLRALTEAVAITLAATLATAPIVAHHFGSVPVAGLAANLVALPAVAPAMWLGMVKAALGPLGTLGPPVGPICELAATGLAAPAAIAVSWLALVAERFAVLPGAGLTLPLGSPAAVMAAYAALALGSLAVRAAAARFGDGGQELAARWRRAGRGRRGALLAAGASALVLAAVRLLGPAPAPDVVTVSFLDVGQGDATLIQDAGGAAVLFDGGPPEAGVSRLLRRAGVRRLAAVVATHPSRDHHGGLAAVLADFPVDLLVDGGDGTPDPGFRSMLAVARRRGIRTVPAIAPLGLALGRLRIRILSPPPRAPGPPPEDPNPRGVVAVVSAPGLRLLLSADAESDALLPLALPPVDAMKVPHHGSADAGLPRVLERLRPRMAAIEVGDNTYGHPTASTLAALRRAAISTYRTDRHGTISLSVQAGGLRVRSENPDPG